MPKITVAFKELPRWMDSVEWYDLNYPEQCATLFNHLSAPCQTPRVPFMVEDLPENFIARPNEFDALVNLLLDRDRKEPIAMTAALRGAGGCGKTTLARALCYDERIQQAFDDGILWITLGEHPGDLKLKVLDLVEVLSGERPGFDSVEAAVCEGDDVRPLSVGTHSGQRFTIVRLHVTRPKTLAAVSMSHLA